jgi:4-hydroxythreonine-4-phosphate dehydrogenase
MSKFIFTCGDTNGIGPEIVIKSLNQLIKKKKNHKFFFICPANIFNKTISIHKPTFKFHCIDYKESNFSSDAQVTVILQPSVNQTIGKPTKASGQASFKGLEYSYEMLKSNLADAVITAPVSKTALRLAGVNYPGQTEMFADWNKKKDFVMTFFSKEINVALYSIHIPLKNVSKSLKSNKLVSVLKILYTALKNDFGIDSPKISVLGLNPHSGESGLIGKEEVKILKPFIKKYSRRFNLSGPYSPDAFFAKKLYKNFDMVLGMYHDQVLIPFKHINEMGGVNYTSGLDIVRTSPDHGVAYDIAGKNLANPSSMIAAFYLAEKIVRNRNTK